MTTAVNTKRNQRETKLITLLQQCVPELKDSIDAIGGCEHNVGVCCCGLRRLLSDIEGTLKEVGA